MRRLLILYILLCMPVQLFSQNYIDYHRIFNRVDEDVLEKEYMSAAARLDTIYNNYDFIYAKHCTKALQIACMSEDSIRAMKWLQKAFMHGVPLWMIHANDITRKVLTYNNAHQVLLQYDSLRVIYYASIDTVLAVRINMLISEDQRLTEKVNNGFILSRGYNYLFRWKKNNRKSFTAIENIVDSFGFPGERLIGLPPSIADSSVFYKHYRFYGPASVVDHRAYTMLIHYYSNKRNSIGNKLLKSLKRGYLAAYQYGALNDFMSEYGKLDNYYNVWHTDKKTAERSDLINKRRYAIGLNTIAQQQRNKLLSRKWRKKGEVNYRVVLE